MSFINPKNIKIYNRFDVLFKYMYILSKENKHESSYYEDAYKNHLEIWNNFLEFNDHTKNSYFEFCRRFDNLIDNIKENGFDANKDGVPTRNFNLLNGAHRASTCLFFNKPLKYYESYNDAEGQLDCSYYFFKHLSRNNKKIEDHFFDQAAVVCGDIFEDLKIVCLFPSAVKDGKINLVKNILNNFGIIYEKTIFLNNLGSINLMKELYKDEEWAEINNGSGYVEKANLCFGQSVQYPMIVFLVRMSKEESIKTKDEIRKIYQIGKHSVHINDTQEETKRISRSLFNKNSIDFLNQANPTKIFTEMLKYFEKTIGFDEGVCVTASMVMAAYGLREAKDIDYIHLKDSNIFEDQMISSHNKYITEYYPETLQDIILDPRNYFFHRGNKFVSLENIKKMKLRRNENKDIKDIKMILEIKNV